MKKELYIFIGIFLFLAIGMHFKEWMSHPVEHLEMLPVSGAYGIGWMHPLVFSAALYLFIGVARLISSGVEKIFKKSEND